MWRRVLSQSPTAVPVDAESSRQTRRYLDGWKALGALLHSGGSLSGHERNVCFLNTHQARFADASAALGLDQDTDSRGLVAVDWDRDGDLDLWLSNRTRPRLSYLQNQIHTGHHYLAVKLRGVSCNRDAIGAKVRVEFHDPGQPPLVQTLSAGEGFVSQASRWLHFGLDDQTQIAGLDITWPGGQRQHVTNLAVDHAYEITQGQPQATAWQGPPPSAPLVARPLALTPAPPTKRIVLPQRLPLPDVPYLDLDGQPVSTGRWVGQPTLVNLWASWCQPCLAELSDWAADAERLNASGIVVLSLNVDQADQSAPVDVTPIRSLVSRLKLPFHGGAVDGASVELLEAVERSLLLHQAPLPIPASFLVDEQGRLAIVYKGPLSIDQLLADGQRLDTPAADPRDVATPFRGKWLTEPFPPDLLSIASQLVGVRRGEAAYEYLTTHVLDAQSGAPLDPWRQLGVTANKVTGVLRNTAELLLAEDRASQAIELYGQAVRYEPNDWELHVRLADLLIRQQQSAEAIQVSQRMTQLKPNHPLPWNNIAWVLATSRDERVRDPKRAMELAERVSQATGQREPSALDTLAVAYAANGQFDDAVATAEKAIARCRELRLDELARTIATRLDGYRRHEAYRP